MIWSSIVINACAMVFLQLLRVLNEPAVHVRTRAMKALSTIIAADPSILSRVGERNDTLALPYSSLYMCKNVFGFLYGNYILGMHFCVCHTIEI